MGWNRGTRVQAALTGCVTVAAAIAAAVGGSASAGVPLASGKVLALLQKAPLALSSYKSITIDQVFHISANGRTVVVTAHGSESPDRQQGSLVEHLPGGLGSVHLLAVGPTVYVQVNAAHLWETSGKPWAAFTITGLSSQPMPTDATGYVRLLAGANGSVQDLGSAKINGVRTEHYHVNIDVLAAYQRLPASLRHDRAAAELKARGITTLPMDVWLDAAGIPRQSEMHESVGGVSIAMRIRYTGSNQPVHVSAPPASQVYQVHSADDLNRLAFGRFGS